MTTIAYFAISLDGFIADPDGGVDWLNEIPNPDQSDYGFAAFVASIDALVMGANTFRVVQSFGVWPYEKPVFVVSNSLLEPPEGYEKRITLVRGEISEVLSSIRAAGHQRLYVDGGQLIRECLRAGLLDEMIVTRIPILLGAGIPLFADDGGRIHCTHLSTEVHGVGLVQSHYQITRGDA